MKKIILILAGFCFLFFDAKGQEIEWQKCLGGDSLDQNFSMIQTSDGGFVYSGWTESNSGDVNGNHGSFDAWIVKTDSTANIIWQKCYGGSSTDRATSIFQTIDGGFVFAGSTYSNDGDVNGNHGMYDFWIVKITNSGSIQWQKCFGGTKNDEAFCIIQTSDSGFAVAGYTESDDGDVTGNHNSFTSDNWVLKLDSIGNLEWQKCLGGTADDMANSIIQINDTSYVITGSTLSNNGDVTGLHGNYDYWLAMFDSGGVQWQKCLGGTSIDKSFSIIHSDDNYLLIAGYSSSNNGNVTGNHGNADYWIVKLDTIGNIIWQKSYGGSWVDEASSIVQTDNGYAIIGQTSSYDVNINSNHGVYDYWLIEIDTAGNLLWQKCLGGSNNDYNNYIINGIVRTNDNGIAISGSSASNNGDVTNIHGLFDYWIAKITDKFNSITGKLFFDFNSNLMQDTGELSINNKMILETNSGRSSYSYLNGDYLVSILDSGNFSVSSSSIDYYNPVPANHNGYFPGIQMIDSLNDFAFQPTSMVNDLCITITPIGPFRENMNASYIINYENVGTTILNGTVIFFPDSDVTYVSSNPIATSVTMDSVVWNLGTLTPFQTGSILVTVHVNAGTPIGTLINSNVRIEPVAGDNYPGCNYAYWEVYTTGAIDPNAILVDRDTVLTTELSSPPYLNYIIYFQNTGNDTAFNARVLNNIPPTLDVNSFEFVASSHPVNINYSTASRLFSFTFDNINLPDSGANEPASHGFIRYRIKPLSTLVVGDSIKNNAAIYFDFNQPVLTDTAVTEIVLPTGVSQWTVVSGQLKIFPNPTNDVITISASQLSTVNCQLSIFDLYGREVFFKQLQTPNLKPQTKIDVSNFSQGVYFIQLQSGEKTLRAKFLKQ